MTRGIRRVLALSLALFPSFAIAQSTGRADTVIQKPF